MVVAPHLDVFNARVPIGLGWAGVDPSGAVTESLVRPSRCFVRSLLLAASLPEPAAPGHPRSRGWESRPRVR